jgi:hypothetical protein
MKSREYRRRTRAIKAMIVVKNTALQAEDLLRRLQTPTCCYTSGENAANL